MIYRSVTIGLLSALVVLVAARPGVVVVRERAGPACGQARRPAAAPPASARPSTPWQAQAARSRGPAFHAPTRASGAPAGAGALAGGAASIRHTPLSAETTLVDVPRSVIQAFVRDPLRVGRAALAMHRPDAGAAGVRVVAAAPGGVVAALGLRPGDVITRIDDTPILAGVGARGPRAAARPRADSRGYYDIAVDRGGRAVRLVVLVHPG